MLRSRRLARLIAQELVRSVEDVVGLLKGRLNLRDLPVRLVTRLLGLFDKLTPPRNSLRRSPQLRSPW